MANSSPPSPCDPLSIPDPLVRKWQAIVDILAEAIQVPAALIMRVHEESIEVFRASASEGNPYRAGETARYYEHCGLYCEHVLRTNTSLLVPDALADRDWKDNPDISQGMIAYLGVPILCPDDTPFGTICVLDSKPNPFTPLAVRLLSQFKDAIEQDLKFSTLQHALEQRVEERTAELTMRGEQLQREIVERKETETMLRESKRHLQEVVANSPYPMCIVDRQGDILSYNRKCIETYGYTLEAVHTAEQWWQAAYPDPRYRKKARDAWESAVSKAQITGEEIDPQEWRLCSKDGTYKDVEFRMVPLGETSIIAMLDLTPSRTLEAALRHSRDEAEAASRAKSEFLANMSHEIRTPLNGVLGMLHLLRETPMNPNQAEYVDMALSSGAGLLEVINDILDLSRIESGKMAMRCEEFEPARIFKSIQSAFTPLAGAKALSILYRIDPALPPILSGDGGRIRQVLFNLVGNAVKFTEQGEVVVRAYPGTPAEGSGGFLLGLEVSDTGIGIAKDKLEDVFEPFTQADGSFTRQYAGTGLGLSIVKRLVKLMGGDIRIASEEGKGTVIHAAIPLKLPKARSPLKKAPRKEAASSPPLTILLAEDDPTNQLLVKRTFEKQGHAVTCAATGVEVLERLKQARFDVIFMDMQMPKMDGMEATRRIRAGEAGVNDPKIHIIALTAHAMQGDRETFLQAGMDGYLAKPVIMTELTEMLKQVAGNALRR